MGTATRASPGAELDRDRRAHSVHADSARRHKRWRGASPRQHPDRIQRRALELDRLAMGDAVPRRLRRMVQELRKKAPEVCSLVERADGDGHRIEYVRDLVGHALEDGVRGAKHRLRLR